MKKIMGVFFISALIFAQSFAMEPVKSFSDPDKVIEVKIGEEFTIVLESNRTTGYGWQIDDPLDKDVLALVGLEYVSSKEKLVGAPGKEIWTFKAVKAGKTAVSFAYVRPWEKNEPAAQKCKFTVTVH